MKPNGFSRKENCYTRFSTSISISKLPQPTALPDKRRHFMGRTIRQRNILFLDENNACLSQMAEAVAKHLNPPKIRVFNAGVQPTSIRPEVYDVMAELGVSLQGQSSKQVSDVPLNDIDLVVSFGDADRKCATL